MRHSQGFTLLELIATLAIVAILVTVAIPALRDTLLRNRLAVQTNEVVRALSIARSEAVMRGVQVTLCKSSTTDTASPICTTAGNWEQGFIVFADANRDNQKQDSEILIRIFGTLPSKLHLKGNNNLKDSISYLPQGITNSQPGTFFLCDEESGLTKARAIIVSRLGRVRLGEEGQDASGNAITASQCGI